MAGQYYTKKEKRRLRRRAGIALGAALLACAAGVIAYQVVDRGTVLDWNAEEAYINETEINGIKCRRRTRIKSYLIMGTDATGPVGAVEEYDGTGQCDVLELLVIDQNADTYALLPINRNTVTEVKTLENDGTYIASSDVQIALAHTMGDGLEISCENTVDAVSHLLYDQPIDGYASLNMDSIKIINRFAGGVTVTVEDDFSRTDPSLKMGETITLTDEQAMHFVHDRMKVGDDTNEGRMRRQKAYLDALLPVLEQKTRQNESFPLEVFEGLQDYMVTDLTGKDCSKIAKAVMKNESLGTLQIQGESSLDYLGYDQFIPDQDSLADVVIQLFYERLDERTGETNGSD